VPTVLLFGGPTRTHTHTHARTHTHTHTRTRLLARACSHAHTHLQTHVHTHTHTRTRLLARTHTLANTCAHAHTHTHTHRGGIGVQLLGDIKWRGLLFSYIKKDKPIHLERAGEGADTSIVILVRIVARKQP
jgi:hypothetical protein